MVAQTLLQRIDRAFQSDVKHFRFQGYDQIEVSAGNLGVERVVPPAGDEHAFDVQRWKRRVTITVSPTGRSVRVWVDGVEIKAA